MADLGAQNAVVGDTSPIDLPETVVDNTELVREKSMAKFSKSKEYQILKDHLEMRIEFFKTRYPNGDPIAAEKDLTKLTQNWIVANLVIGEFKAILDAYENANEAVKDAARRQNS